MQTANCITLLLRSHNFDSHFSCPSARVFASTLRLTCPIFVTTKIKQSLKDVQQRTDVLFICVTHFRYGFPEVTQFNDSELITYWSVKRLFITTITTISTCIPPHQRSKAVPAGWVRISRSHTYCCCLSVCRTVQCGVRMWL